MSEPDLYDVDPAHYGTVPTDRLKGRGSIERLRGRLRADNPIRRAADRILGVEQPHPDDLGSCMDALNWQSAPRWRERTVAAWVLGAARHTSNTRAAAADALARVLDNFDLKKETRGRIARAALYGIPLSVGTFLLFYFGGGLEAILGMTSLIISNPETSSVDIRGIALLGASSFVSMVGLALGGYVSIYVDHRRINRIRLEAAKALGALKPAAYLGALARGMADVDASIRRESTSAFQATLPAVNDEMEGQLPRSLGAQLCGILRRGRPDLQLAILPALAFVGGGEAIGTVERVLKTSRSQEVRTAAQQVLPVLTARRDAARMSDRLLRPSVMDETGLETLLRPSCPVSSTDAELLLRTSAEEETH